MCWQWDSIGSQQIPGPDFATTVFCRLGLFTLLPWSQFSLLDSGVSISLLLMRRRYLGMNVDTDLAFIQGCDKSQMDKEMCKCFYHHRAEFLNLSTIVICGQKILCRRLSCTLNLYLLEDSSSLTPGMTTKRGSRHCQMSPGVGARSTLVWEPLMWSLYWLQAFLII